MRTDWVIRLLKVLEEDAYRKIMGIAFAKGLKMDGVKARSKCYQAIVLTKLRANGNKMKKLEQLKCITDAILEYCEELLENGSEDSFIELLDQVTCTIQQKGETEDEKVEQMLQKLEANSNPKDKKQMTEQEENTIDHAARLVLFEKRIEELEKQVARFEKQEAELNARVESGKAKNKKLEEKIRKLNMQNEAHEKNIKKYQKELKQAKDCENQEEECATLKAELEQLQQRYDRLEKEKREEVKELEEVKNQLKLYQEENSTKVLCFTKKKLPADEFLGYQIQCASSFSPEQRIPWESYDEVWAITKDFSYGMIREMERAAGKTVQTFYSHKLITTV